MRKTETWREPLAFLASNIQQEPLAFLASNIQRRSRGGPNAAVAGDGRWRDQRFFGREGLVDGAVRFDELEPLAGGEREAAVCEGAGVDRRFGCVTPADFAVVDSGQPSARQVNTARSAGNS